MNFFLHFLQATSASNFFILLPLKIRLRANIFLDSLSLYFIHNSMIYKLCLCFCDITHYIQFRWYTKYVMLPTEDALFSFK